MELLYFWIEDFRNIKQQNVLLSDKFKIEFNPKDSCLTIDDNREYIADFFGSQISNITAIVGQNGTGKTSILDFIKDKLAISDEYLRHKLIFAIREKGSKGFNHIIYIHNINENSFHIKNDSQHSFALREYKQHVDQSKSTRLINKRSYGVNESELLKPSIFEALPDFESTKFVFYSNIFDYREENSSSLLYNCSTNYLVETQPYKLRNEEIKTQINYIINNQGEELDINIPTNINLSFRNTILIQTAKRLAQFNSDFVKEFNAIHKRKEYSSIPRWKKVLITSVTLNHIDEWIFQSYPLGYKHIQLLTSILLPSNLHTLSDTSGAIGFYEVYKNIIKSFGNAYQGLINSNNFVLISELDINAQHENANNLLNFLDILYTLPNENVSSKGGEYNISLPITLRSADLLNAYIKSFRRKSIIDLDWQDMSSGEKARLAFLARLFDIRNKSQFGFSLKGIKSLIFLIDEGEQYFHPDWQKRYIQFLINHLGKLFPKQSIQIVLTSHSPFVLSDLTRSNVVYLMKIANDKKHPKILSTVVADSSTKEQTFASNIHLLFTDAYFMRDGLIGEFAKDKINNMLEPLIHKKVTQSKLQGIKDFISVIGEPIIKGKLNEMLADYIESKGK